MRVLVNDSPSLEFYAQAMSILVTRDRVTTPKLLPCSRFPPVRSLETDKRALNICLAHSLPPDCMTVALLRPRVSTSGSSFLGGRAPPGMTNSWAGAVVPFGVDALVIYLASTYGEVFWIFPLIVTMGSLAGNALTYWIGRCAGDAGLPRLLAPRQLDRMKASVQKTGAGRLAAAAVLPPPFPLTPFVLTCGALDLDRRRFFLVFGVMRLIRFTALALLARHYGDRVRKSSSRRSFKPG